MGKDKEFGRTRHHTKNSLNKSAFIGINIASLLFIFPILMTLIYDESFFAGVLFLFIAFVPMLLTGGTIAMKLVIACLNSSKLPHLKHDVLDGMTYGILVYTMLGLAFLYLSPLVAVCSGLTGGFVGWLVSEQLTYNRA